MLTQRRFETAPGEQAQCDWGQISVPLVQAAQTAAGPSQVDPGGALSYYALDGSSFPKIVMDVAVIDLFERMVARNLVGADLHPGNVYFCADRTGRARASVWCTDFILRPDRPIDPRVRSGFLYQVQGKQAARDITGPTFDFDDPRGSMQMMYRMQWEHR